MSGAAGQARTVADGVDTREGRVDLIGSALAFADRSVRHFLRSPEMVITSVVFPLLLLLTMLAVFSTAVERYSGDTYAQIVVPGLVMSSVIFGTMATANAFYTDLNDGFMDRVRSMPVPTAAPLLGMLAAEVIRAVLAILVLCSVGAVFGFRFAAGPLAAIGFVATGALIAVSTVWIGVWLATTATTQEAVGPPMNAVFLVMLFFSGALVPREAYPDWAQTIVAINPATAYVTLLDHLARGGELLGPTLWALGWSAVLIVVFAGLAVRRLRR